MHIVYYITLATNLFLFAHLSSSLHSLFHITDWLPTLMSVATLGSFPSSHAFSGDGLDQWKSLSGNRRSKRREMLYNINPVQSFRREVNAAIRYSHSSKISLFAKHSWQRRMWLITENNLSILLHFFFGVLIGLPNMYTYIPKCLNIMPISVRNMLKCFGQPQCTARFYV